MSPPIRRSRFLVNTLSFQTSSTSDSPTNQRNTDCSSAAAPTASPNAPSSRRATAGREAISWGESTVDEIWPTAARTKATEPPAPPPQFVGSAEDLKQAARQASGLPAAVRARQVAPLCRLQVGASAGAFPWSLLWMTIWQCTVRGGALKQLSNRGPVRGSRDRLEPRLAVVGTQSLGHPASQADRQREGHGWRGARKLAVILHRTLGMPSRELCGPDSEDQNDCAADITRPPLPTPRCGSPRQPRKEQ